MARPQRLNADYFSHDSDMRNDPKIKALRKNFGFLGYSVWCFLLEMLTDQDNFRLLWTDLNIELIAADFDCDYQQLKDVADYLVRLDLMQKDENYLVCKKQVDRLDPLIQKRKRRRTDVMDDHNAVNKELWTSETPKIVVSDVCNTQTKLNKTKLNEIKLNNKEINHILTDIVPLEKKTNDENIFIEVLDRWNKFAIENGFCEILELTAKRKVGIRTRIKNKRFDLGAIFIEIKRSDFLMGKNDRSWKVNFDFIFCRADKWVKILEGTYSDQKDENEYEKRRRIFNEITKK